jgi:hypothetical protein
MSVLELPLIQVIVSEGKEERIAPERYYVNFDLKEYV